MGQKSLERRLACDVKSAPLKTTFAILHFHFFHTLSDIINCWIFLQKNPEEKISNFLEVGMKLRFCKEVNSKLISSKWFEIG